MIALPLIVAKPCRTSVGTSETMRMILGFLTKMKIFLFGPRYHPERHYMRGRPSHTDTK